MKLKVITIIFCLLTFLSAKSQNFDNLVVGHKESDTFKFVRDTIKLKDFFAQFIADSLVPTDIPEFDKISIEQSSFRGDVPNNIKRDFFYLLCINKKYKLKFAITLYELNDELILFYNNPSLTDEDRDLGKRYIICYGSDEDCSPKLLYSQGRKRWSSAEVELYYCDPNDPCKGISGIFTF